MNAEKTNKAESSAPTGGSAQPRGGARISKRIADLLETGNIHEIAITYVREFIDATANSTITLPEAGALAEFARKVNEPLFYWYVIHYNTFLQYAIRITPLRNWVDYNSYIASTKIMWYMIMQDWKGVRKELSLNKTAPKLQSGKKLNSFSANETTIRELKECAAKAKHSIQHFKSGIAALYAYAEKYEKQGFRPLEVMPSTLKIYIDSTEKDYNAIFSIFTVGKLAELIAHGKETDEYKMLALMPVFKEVKPNKGKVELYKDLLEDMFAVEVVRWQSQYIPHDKLDEFFSIGNYE